MARARTETETQVEPFTMRRYGKGHAYYIGKKKVPGVTTALSVIAKEALIRWAANVEREMILAACGGVFMDLMDNLAAGITHGAAWEKVRPTDHAIRAAMEEAIGRKRAHQQILDDASDIGKQAHSLIEWYWKKSLYDDAAGANPGDMPALPDDEAKARQIRSCYDSFVDWAQSVQLQPLASEVAVVSRTHEVAGTLDHLALIAGKVSLLDWKSAKGIYFNHALQVSAYRALYNEEPMVRGIGHVDECWVVQLPKTPEIGLKANPQKFSAEACDAHAATFFTALALHRDVAAWEAAHPWRDRYKPKPGVEVEVEVEESAT